MDELTIEEKAELFDYLASVLMEFKVEYEFGGNDWAYHDKGTPEELADTLRALRDMDSEAEDEEDDD